MNGKQPTFISKEKNAMNSRRGDQAIATLCVLVGLSLMASGCLNGGPLEEDQEAGWSQLQRASTSGPKVKCWRQADYDEDGDGYARANAPGSARVEMDPDGREVHTCPAGWVGIRGDCNDNPLLGGAAIHPRQKEKPENGIDDNCNNLVDEPTVVYRYNNYSGQNDFTMEVRINDAAVAAAIHSPRYVVTAKVYYQRLKNTGETFSTPLLPVAATDFGTYHRTFLTVEELERETVYRARVQFYRRYIPPFGTSSGYKPTPIGETSDWYYTMTDGPSSMPNKRMRVLLWGFYEYQLGNNMGMTGYYGDPFEDGSRYGADASRDEEWCSEFYSWVVDRVFDMDHMINIAALRSYFAGDYGCWWDDPTPWELRNWARPGDYLALDSSNDGVANHSGMFLAYDSNLGRIWTLEGNTSGYFDDEWDDVISGGDSRAGGNETVIRNRDCAQAMSWGWLDYRMQ